MSRAWTESENAICRAALASGLDVAATRNELAKWGWHRTIEGVAAHLQTVRRQLRTETDSEEDREMLRYSISRKWL